MNQFLTQLVLKLLDRQLKKPKEAADHLVYLNPVLLWVGIVCTVLFLIPGLIVPLATGDWGTWPFLLFAAMSGSLIVAYRNCRIWYDEEGFTASYFLGCRRHFTYDEIESIEGLNRDVKLKVRGCTVRVDEAAVGRREFLSYARKRYRTGHGGKPIPAVQNRKWDIFNGHVDNPGEFLAAYVFISLFFPVLIIILLFVSGPTPVEEMAAFTGPLEYASIEDNDLLLRGNGRELEIWDYQNTLTDPEAFLQRCRIGETFHAAYRTVTNDDGEITDYSVEYIEDLRGRIWITPEAAYRNRMTDTVLLFGVMELIWLLICGMSIYVGRNPRKFSKKVIRLFFKEGYVH